MKLEKLIDASMVIDKNGEMTDFLHALGFGFLELGSITALPCAGNNKPNNMKKRTASERFVITLNCFCSLV